LAAKIKDVESQLHTAMGATHKAAMLAQKTPPRIPTIHQLNNYITNTRRRLKHIEDIDGTTPCAKLLMKLQAQNGIPAASTKTAEDTLEQSDLDDDDAEDEEEILARQVAQTTPATTKKVTIVVPTQQPKQPEITPQIATIAVENTVKTKTTPAQPPQPATTTSGKW
jgi:hypothetical protein